MNAAEIKALQDQAATAWMAIGQIVATVSALVPDPPAVYRPFAATSPWNTPIPAGAQTDPNNTALGQHMLGNGDVKFWLNLTTSGVTIWQADAGTPRYDVHLRLGTNQVMPNVPVPVGAVGANGGPNGTEGGDGHMTIIDLPNHMSYDFFQPRRAADGKLNAAWGASYDLQGDGCKPRGQSSATAAGFSLLAGLIRPDEMRAGRIAHALLFSCDKPGTCLVWPASTNAGVAGQTNALPMGARLQLDPALDLNTLQNITPAGKIIARALQEYGMILADGGSGISIYGESFWGKTGTSPWTGVLKENEIVWVPLHAHLRVLALGPQDCAQP